MLCYGRQVSCSQDWQRPLVAFARIVYFIRPTWGDACQLHLCGRSASEPKFRDWRAFKNSCPISVYTSSLVHCCIRAYYLNVPITRSGVQIILVPSLIGTLVRTVKSYTSWHSINFLFFLCVCVSVWCVQFFCMKRCYFSRVFSYFDEMLDGLIFPYRGAIFTLVMPILFTCGRSTSDCYHKTTNLGH